MIRIFNLRRLVVIGSVLIVVQLLCLPLYWHIKGTPEVVTDTPSQSEAANLKLQIDQTNVFKNGTLVANSTIDEIDSFIHRRLNSKLDKVFTSDDFNTNWELFTSLHFKEANTDPYFYQKQRADFHLYDPRITMSVYINYIADVIAASKRPTKDKKQLKQQQLPTNTSFEVPFSWQDWVDLSVLNDYLVWDEGERPTCEDIIDHGILYNPISGVKKPDHERHKDFCIDNAQYNGHVSHHLLPGFSITGDAGTHFNYLEKLIQSRSYILSSMPQPEKLVFLTDSDNIYEFDVDHSNHTTMIENGLFQQFVQNKRKNGVLNSKNVNFNPTKEIDNLSKVGTPIQPEIDFTMLLNASNSYTLDVSKKRFRYEPRQLYDSLASNYQNLTRSQKTFVSNLERTLDADMLKVPKSFAEANMDDHSMNGHRVLNLGHHYDLRFFNGFISESKKNFFDNTADKQKMILHHMLHTWLQFSFKAGVITYPAHGSLLSWYWDGMIFPWDEDIDVITPIQDLSDLCMNYNNSLIIQSPTDGFSKYYLDCTSSITVREHGNGANNIDARFIDVDSGMYIDITGLAVTGDKRMDTRTADHFQIPKLEDNTDNQIYKLHDEHDIYNCRNSHFYSHDEISPLRFTLMEHGPTFVPSKIEDSLIAEYVPSAIVSINYHDHLFVQELRLWVPLQNVLTAARSINSTIEGSKNALVDFYKENTLEVVDALLKDDDIITELTQTWFQTRAQRLETSLLKKLSLDWDFDLGQDKHEYFKIQKEYNDLMLEYLNHHPPMRKTVFDYNIQVEMLKLNLDLDFNREEISKFIKK